VKTVKVYAGVLKTNPSSVPGLARCLDELLDVAEKDPTVLEAKAPADPKPKATRESADVVKGELKIDPPAADGSRKATVTLTIEKPWHIYANPVGDEMLKPSQTSIEVLIDGKPVAGVTVTYPQGKAIKDAAGSEYRIYEGSVAFTVTLPAAAKAPEVRVRVIACKEGTCLLSSVLKLK
jgi:archaellum component FlaG (FlaF/FlaG flagellin family)